jgi:hypothetical protein
MRSEYLSHHPAVFQKCSGLTVTRLDQLVEEVVPLDLEADARRLNRPDRPRDRGAGHRFEREVRDQLLTVIGLRLDPIHEGLADRFGVSGSTGSRLLEPVLPVLEASGRDPRRWPDPGRKQRRQLPDWLTAIPELTVMVDRFEQRLQRPPDADHSYSGQQKQHPLKSQIALDRDTGPMVDGSDRVPGPTADIPRLEPSGLLERWPDEVGLGGDLADRKRSQLRRAGFSPRRKPPGPDRPPEDGVYHRAFAPFRMIVEQTMGQLRRFQRVTATDRNHRRQPTARVAAVAGLVNRLPRFALA